MLWQKKQTSPAPESGLDAGQQYRLLHKRRIMFLLIMSFLITCVGVFVGGYAYVQRKHAISRWQESEAQRQEAITRLQEAEQARIAEQEQRQAAEAQRSEARRNLYFSSILLAHTHCDNGRYDLAQEALWQAPLEYANWEWGYLMGQCNQDLATLEGHESVVSGATFSPDGSRIITTSWGNDTIHIWNAATGEEMKMFEGGEYSGCPFSFSLDGSRIAIADEDNTACVWDVSTLEPLVVLEGHHEYIHSVAFSRDGSHIVTASMDNTARIWETATGKQLMVLEGPGADIANALFSPDGLRVATGDRIEGVRIWDVATGEQLAATDIGCRHGTSTEFSPDGSLLVIYMAEGCAAICDAAAKDLEPIAGIQCDCITDVAFSPDGTRFVIVDAGPSSHSAAHLWDTTTRKQVAALEGHQEFVNSVTFSPDGSRFVTASKDTTARVWDAITGKETAVLKGHKGAVSSAVFSPDGLRIVTASEDKTARIWDTTTGREISVFTGHSDALTNAVFSPDGSRVVTTSKDQTARIWDAAPWRTSVPIKEYKGQWNSTGLSPDGKRVVTVSDDTVRICDAETKKELLVLKGYGYVLTNAGFILDGSLQIGIVANNSTVHFLDAVPWRLEGMLKVAGEFTNIEEEYKARFQEWKRLRYATWIQDRGIGLEEEEEVAPKTEEDREQVARTKTLIAQLDEKLNKYDEHVLLFAQIAPAEETDTARNTASTKIVQVKDQESWPEYETVLTYYAVLLRDDNTIAAFNETPQSLSGDWVNDYMHYYDENGNTIAFKRYSGFFNDCVAPPDTPDDFVAKETSTYYFRNHKLITKDYVLVDKDNNALAPTQCEFSYRFDYTIHKTWEESQAAAKISLTRNRESQPAVSETTPDNLEKTDSMRVREETPSNPIQNADGSNRAIVPNQKIYEIIAGMEKIAEWAAAQEVWIQYQQEKKRQEIEGACLREYQNQKRLNTLRTFPLFK